MHVCLSMRWVCLEVLLFFLAGERAASICELDSYQKGQRMRVLQLEKQDRVAPEQTTKTSCEK